MHPGCPPLAVLLGLAVSAQQPAQPAETGRVEGRVVDLLGEPLVAATVVVTPWMEPDAILARGMTDGEGRFVIGKVPLRDQWGVGARAAGRTGARVWVVPGRGPVTVRLPEAVCVSGHVRGRDGKAVAGVTVCASLAFARELEGARDQAVTDGEGFFELKNAPPGFLCVAAVIPGVGLGLAWQHVTQDTVIDIGPPAGKSMAVAIEVVGLPDDGPPPGAAVVISSGNGLCRQLPPPWNRLPLGRSGRVVVAELLEAPFLVTVDVPGFVCQPMSGELRPDAKVLRVQATRVGDPSLQWAGTLRGYGEPLAGVGLEVRGNNSGPRTTAVTGSDGRWRVDLPVAAGSDVVIRLLPGDLVLDVPSGDSRFDPRRASEYRCRAQPDTPLELRAIAGAQVTGKVLRPDGQLAPLVAVSLEQCNVGRTPTWLSFATATTDMQGRYVFRGVHPNGQPVRVSVQGAEGTGEGAEFALDKPGMQVASPVLAMSAPSVVDGDVRDAQGKPVRGLRVWLRDWDLAQNRPRSGGLVETYTDREGRFRFLGVPTGGAYLQLALDEETPKSNAAPPFEVEAGKVRTLHLTWPVK